MKLIYVPYVIFHVNVKCVFRIAVYPTVQLWQKFLMQF